MATGKVINTFLSDVNWQSGPAGDFVLPANTVQIWRIQTSAHTVFIPKLSALLTEAEKLRGSKYIHQRDRDRFTVSRGAQRLILSKYLNITPALLEFVLGDNKKPFVVTTAGVNLQFNLSHSGDWILLAVSHLQVGSDVEYIDPNFDFADILPEHFSKEEAAYVDQEEKAERFYRLWTRKESLLKATGQGLGEHLKHTPALDGGHEMHASLLNGNDDWNISTFNVSDDHIGSVAVKGISAQLQFWSFDLGGVIFH